MIRIEQLSFSYDHRDILREITLTIPADEIVTLLGPNGSGKSTLLKCIYGTLNPKQGKITIDGRGLSEYGRSELARTMGGIPQHHYPAFPFNVLDIVVMGRTPFLNLFESPSKDDYRQAEDMLQHLGIDGLKKQKYTEISGGERQLVLLARTLMQNPKILLLDEPITHLDIKNKVHVLGAIRKIAKTQGLTVLATLHDPNDAVIFSDRIALMKKGKVFECGVPAEVVNEKNMSSLYGMAFDIISRDGIHIVSYKI